MSSMRRRVLGGLAGTALVLGASPALSRNPGLPRRVVMFNRLAPEDAHVMKHWRDRFAANGWVQGQSLELTLTNLHGREDMAAQLAHEVVEGSPDLLLVAGLTNTRLFQGLTQTIPIVFMEVADPVDAGLVESLRRPGRNITGASSRYLELVGKRFELLKDLKPNVTRVALLMGDHGFTYYSRDAFERPARELGMHLVPVDVHAAESLSQRQAILRAARVDAAYAYLGFYGSKAQLDLVVSERIPTVFFHHQTVADGGLISLGEWWLDPDNRAIDLASRVLGGQSPGTLPIDQLSRPYLAVNLRTARLLGLTVPRSIMLRAHEVHE